MIRTDRMSQWADTRLDARKEPPAPPATAFDGDVFHSPIAAHAATEVGSDEDRFPGFGAVMVPLAVPALTGVIGLVAVVGYIVSTLP